MSFNKLFIIATAARSFIMERTELESLIREELIYALAENKEHAKEILQLDEAGVGDFLKGAWQKTKRAVTGDDSEKWSAIGRGEDPDKDVSYDPFSGDDDESKAGPTIRKTAQQLMAKQDEIRNIDDPAKKKKYAKWFALAARQIIRQSAHAHTTEEADAWKELLALAQAGMEMSGGEAKVGEKPSSAATGAPDAAKAKGGVELGPGGEVPLFKGKGSIGPRLFNSLKSRSQGTLDNDQIQNLVKSIMKDLSAQLRINGLKVQESNNMFYPLLMERGPAPEASRDPEQARKATKAAKYVPGGKETQKKTGEGGRVKPQKGKIDVSRATFGKLLQGTALNQKEIMPIVKKLLKPYIQRALAAAGREDIKITESYMEDVITAAVESIVLEKKIAESLAKELKRRQLI